MWVILILIVTGFALGCILDFPFHLFDKKYLAVIFLALLDSLTFALARDLSEERVKNNVPVLIRLLFGTALGCFIIYFGEKSQIDLFIIALLPLGIGITFNLYKFLPK